MKPTTSWLIVILLLGIIFYFSGQASTEQDITPYIKEYPQLINLLKHLPDIHFYYYNHHLISSHQNTVGFIQFIIRKITHLCLYGVFGLTLLQALQASRSAHKKNPPGWPVSVTTGLLIIIIASLDEYQQSLTASRTGCIQDVVVDFCGFLLFYALYRLWQHLRPQVY
jgi:VanZ family protein